MNFNFELILFYAIVITGSISLLDILYFAPRRHKKKQLKTNAFDKVQDKSQDNVQGVNQKMPLIFEYARDFFPVLLVVFLLRAFLYEPFRIPSTSLVPTLLVGDFILVNKYDYGIRVPVIHKKLIERHEPQRGDILVLRWPPNPSINFIKRVIGVPGDHISYINKELYVNNKKVTQEFIGDAIYLDENGIKNNVIEKQEDLLGVKHKIYVDNDKFGNDYKDVIVPPNMYFVMGDNRDNSADSRYWGFVPEDNIVGKAVMVWMSWDSNAKSIRWNRLGKSIN